MNISLNIDVIIFVGFLIINLIIGLFYSRGVKNIKEYAVGNRNFSTATIAATLIATWISGSAFLTDISEVYKNGIFYMVPGMFGDIFSWIIICYFLAPRMGRFLGSVSVAEAMGNLYGKQVRLITSISSTVNCIGKVAAQFKVSATILQLFFGISSFYATLASSIIVIIYSSFGGIRAVTFTDIIQFFTFGTVIPIIALVIWGTFSDPYIVFHTLSNDPLFDYTKVFDHTYPKFWEVITLMLYFIIPSLNPAVFQRISMAKNVKQVSDSFFIATFIRLFISIMFFWIGILLLSSNPDIEPNKLFSYIIDNYTFYIGFKGIIAAGVMAMVMSTADSYINSAAITLSYDFRKSLNSNISEKYDLPLSYICSITIGILAFGLAFYMKGLLSIFLMVSSFYLPIVTVPLLFSIFGFHTSTKSVLIGMAAGLITVLIWRIYLLDITNVDSVIPGTLANLIFFIGSHYLLKQPGGWVNIQGDDTFKMIKLQRKRRLQKIIKSISHFNFITFCKKNSPKQDYMYSLFGFFGIISVFSIMYSLPHELQHHVLYSKIIEFIYHTALLSLSVFLTYPIWPATFKKENFIVIVWNIAVPYILLFCPVLLIIISNFGEFQLMILMINIIIMAILFRWQVVIIMMFIGIISSIKFYQWFAGTDMDLDLGSLQFKIMYLLLLVSSILIAFLKPTQQYQALTKKLNIHLTNRIGSQEKQVRRALGIREEFIRNIQHEYNTPMTGILSMADALKSAYYHLNDERRLKAIDDILQSAEELKIYDENLQTLAKLSKNDYRLERTDIDFSDLVYDRLDICRKLYEENKGDREFILNIEDKITLNGDKHYLTQVLDNLIINAISYCKEGKITIVLKQNEDGIEFIITDEGIGIPNEELELIFGEFVVSSKTHSYAGGRGVGLALARRVIEVHGGDIYAESDGNKGATFTFVLPKK